MWVENGLKNDVFTTHYNYMMIIKLFYFHIKLLYHLIVHNMKNINFQVKFHVFCMFEKKACFIPILVNRVGLTAVLITKMDKMRSQRGPLEKAAREGI